MGDDEQIWRAGWAAAYSGMRLYHDDGELQDNAEAPAIDWLRDTPREIRDKIAIRAMRKLAPSNG